MIFVAVTFAFFHLSWRLLQARDNDLPTWRERLKNLWGSSYTTVLQEMVTTIEEYVNEGTKHSRESSTRDDCELFLGDVTLSTFSLRALVASFCRYTWHHFNSLDFASLTQTVIMDVKPPGSLYCHHCVESVSASKLLQNKLYNTCI
jgi:hypothetical protein